MLIHVQLAAQRSGSAGGPGAIIRIQQYLFDENTVTPPVYCFTDDSQVDTGPIEHQDFDLAGTLSSIKSGKKSVLRTKADSHAVSFAKKMTPLISCVITSLPISRLAVAQILQESFARKSGLLSVFSMRLKVNYRGVIHKYIYYPCLL